MLAFEKRPTEMLFATNELRKLIIENPDVPLLVFAGEDCNRGEWCYESCTNCSVKLGEFLDCMQEIDPEICFDDRDEFQEALEDHYSDFDGSDNEFEQFIENKMLEYDSYWKKCIILYVNN